jgi:tetratricopeptide (TPR) repeat protein
MRRWLLILLIILLGAAVSAPCRAQENARRFIAAMEAYKAEDYATAIAEMESIAQSGVRNGALYYNLGSAHLKNNSLGPAILWYERALKLLPNDPDLRFNADYARSLTRDATEDPGASLVRIFFFWKYHLSSHTIIILAVAFNLLFWLLMLARRFSGRRGFRYAATAVTAPTIIFIMTAVFNYYEAAHQRHGIVLTDKVSVRSGLKNTSTELFVLHAGAKVKVVKKKKDHLQIRYSKDKIGWIENETVGLI